MVVTGRKPKYWLGKTFQRSILWNNKAWPDWMKGVKHWVEVKINVHFAPLITARKKVEPLSSGIVRMSFALKVMFAMTVI